MCANKRKICKKTILKYSFCIIYQKFDFLSEYFHIPFMLVCNWKYIIWHSEKDSCKLTVYIVANEPEREKERMGKRVSSSSWLGMENVFLLLGIGLIVFSNGVYGMSKERKASMEMEIDRKLKLLNKPAVKSIQVSFLSSSSNPLINRVSNLTSACISESPVNQSNSIKFIFFIKNYKHILNFKFKLFLKINCSRSLY